MELKQLGIALTVVGLLSANAYANDAASEPPIAAAFTETDLSALFEQTDKPMQLAALSQQEMKETDGAWLLNFAGGILGGFSGAYGYMTSSAYNRNANPSSAAWGLTRSIAVGAGTGAIRPVNSFGRAFGTLAGSVGYGRIDGFAGSRGWW